MLKSAKKFSTLFIILALLLLNSITFTPITASAAGPVTVFSDTYNNGTSMNLNVGSYNISQLGSMNDSISSIKIAQGYKVTLYADPDYTGASQVFVDDYADLNRSSFDNTVSSIKVESINLSDYPVMVFQDYGLAGPVQLYNTGRFDITQTSFNDSISSIRVASGYKVSLYENSNFTGTYKQFVNSYSNMDNCAFNDKASSLIVENIGTYPVYVYDDPDYAGHLQQFNVGSYNLYDYSLDDLLSSIKVTSGYKLTLYADPNCTGASKVFLGDYTYLGNCGFDDTVTSIKIETVNLSNYPVIGYLDNDFTGPVQFFNVGNYTAGNLIANDAFSSFKIAAGYKVSLYYDNNYSGDWRCFTDDQKYLKDSGFDDCVSSIKVEKMTSIPPVVAYIDDQYHNSAQPLFPGNYNTSDLYWNDAISSLRITPGYKITLYKDANWTGNSISFTNDCLQLSDFNFNDTVSSLKIENVGITLDSTCVEVPGNAFTSSSKASLLLTFSPRVWLAANERFMPSSVDWAVPNLTRFANSKSNYTYCYTTTQPIKTSDKLPYFSGNLNSAIVYSYWVEKASYQSSTVDLSYFYYYPYNWGKIMLNTEFGDHVSDWEHVTVRLVKFSVNGKNYVKPIQVNYPYHSLGASYPWEQVAKYNTTHPIGYSAYGSHGMWKDPGNHAYVKIPIFGDLVDNCNEGTTWDATASSLATYEYFPKTRTGNAIGTSTWPDWMNRNYIDPFSNCIDWWGNNADGNVFGQDRLTDGPTGPQEKEALKNFYDLR